MLQRYFGNTIARVFAAILTAGMVLVTVSAYGWQRSSAPASGSASAAGSSLAKSPNRALIDQYCTNCHNADDKVAGLDLEGMSLDQIAEGAETWEKVVKKLRGGMMPPLGQPKPTQAGVDS
jgi:hypothetical protein